MTIETVETEDGWDEFWEEWWTPRTWQDTGVAVRDAEGVHWLAWTSEDGDTYCRSYPMEGDETEADTVAVQGITLASALAYPVTVWLDRAHFAAQANAHCDKCNYFGIATIYCPACYDDAGEPGILVPDDVSARRGLANPEASAALTRLSQWIDASNEHRDSEAVTWGRIAKLMEEGGEAVAAFIGYTGQNPRKGVTHTRDDLEKELLDSAITALGAIEHLRGHDGRALELLNTAILRVAARASASESPEVTP